MEPTDAMVEAAYVAVVGSFETGYRDVERLRYVTRDDIKTALRAVMPITATDVTPYDSGYREGWIACRDAAASEIERTWPEAVDLIDAINAKEPPT